MQKIFNTATDETGQRVQTGRRAIIMGWILAIAGSVLWAYGFYAGAGGAPVVSWPQFVLDNALPNWICELGLGLSTVGTIPLCCAQFCQARSRALEMP